MNEKPRVTVIVDTYNNAEHIAECLECLSNQTLREIEILVIDLSSTDGTLDIISEYARLDRRMRLLSDKSGSAGHAKNMAMDAAIAPFVVFIGAEDCADPDMLERMYGEFEDEPHLDVVLAETDTFGDGSIGKGNKDVKKRLSEANRSPEQTTITRDANMFRFMAFDCIGMYRKSFLIQKKIRYYEESAIGAQDAEFRFLSIALGQSFTSPHKVCDRRMELSSDSINDRKSAVSLCAEYRQLRRHLKALPDMWTRFRYVFWQAYFQGNLDLYEALSLEMRSLLSARMHDDIQAAIRDGEFAVEHSDVLTRELLNLLLESPAAFDREWRGINMDAQVERARRLMEQEAAEDIEIEKSVAAASPETKDDRRTYGYVDKKWLTDEMSRDLAPLRLLLGLTAEEMGSFLGVSGAVYKGMETGKRSMTWDQYLALLFMFRYNRRTEPIVESLGLYPEPLHEDISKGTRRMYYA